MATLTMADIAKRNNVDIIARRLDGGAFQLKDAKSELYEAVPELKITTKSGTRIVKKNFAEALRNFLKTRERTDKVEICLKDKRKKIYVNITSVFKDSELAGGRTGGGTAREDAELTSLREQIKDAILRGSTRWINVKVNGVTHRVTDAQSTPGTPKSDFHLLDDNGKECVWISHKHGTTAKDFQQWGGVSEREFPKTPKEVLNFAEVISVLHDGAIPRARTYARPIKTTALKMQAVYGVDYGKALGRQNVSMLLQGTVRLVKKGRHYEIVADHVHYNGEQMKGDYEPVLMAMYKGDRSNFGVKGARFGISPRASRSRTVFI